MAKGSRTFGADWLPLAFVVALAPLVAGLRHGFYLDDFTWLERAHLSGHSILRVLTPWKSYEVRCLGQLLFWIEYQVFRDSAFPYNLVSLGLHLGNAFLVGKLARSIGLSARHGAIASLLFLAGVGHYAKPVAWSCAQVLMLATLFAAMATLRFFSHHATSDCDRNGRFPWECYLLLALGMASHEIVLLAPFGLALAAFVIRHRFRRRMLVIAVPLIALYLALTASYHLKHPAAHGTIGGIFRNLFLFPAAYLLPAQAPRALARLVPAGGSGVLPLSMLRLLPFALGAFVSGLALLHYRSAPARERALAAVGASLFLPILAMPSVNGWVEVRYLYPSAICFAPSLVTGLMRAFDRATSARRIALRGALCLWFLCILTGSIYIQRRAMEEARMPQVQQRWERLEDVRAGRPPRW